ncbi:MAG: transglycosylase SLT domain-containing protein [Chitinispirillaceae bacterium]|nr:transglycosylase SLT domain-containing protein [Chitinispirillaceae bacterium]
MSTLPRLQLFVLAAAIISLPHAGNFDNDTIFPTPDILVDNVAFWKKIYTEVSMKEGLLHDRDYPMVIYGKITSDGRSHAVKAKKQQIGNALTRIASAPDSEWSEYERGIATLFFKEADSSAITGADDRIRFQQGQKERFKEGLKRSGMYLDTIRAILRAYGVPLRLAYLPHVESSFNTEAYSKVGAAGLWQFMRGTGKIFGMRIDYTIDERRDPVKATIGAAKYLSSSYAELGTWPLAITSYNHGVYGMKRAVKQTESRDIAVIIQNYKSRSFQFASSNFYGCFLAASSIADSYTKYFPGLKLHSPVSYNDFTISHYVGAEDFCSYLGIPTEQLMRYNPALRPSVFSKHQQLPKGYAIHLPAVKSIAEVTAAYNSIPDSLKRSEPPRPQYYRVRRGDNLYGIASRLGVSVRELAYENNITKINRIRSGQILRIPPKAGAVSVTTVAVATKTEPEEKAVTDTAVTVAAATPPPVADTTEQVYPVSEAAAEIARAEDEASMPPEELAMVDTGKKSFWDKLKPQPRKTEKQKTPEPQPEEPSASAALTDSLKEIAFAPAIVEPVETATGKPRITPDFDVSIYDLDAILSTGGTEAKIFVSVDETIGHYADWLGIPTWRIRKLNGMGRRSNIRINQKLHIPIDRPDALEQFAAARLEYHMAIEEDFYAQYTVGDVQPYKLKRGEALWDLCNNNENPLPLWLFRKYNRHLDLVRLPAGSEVWIPQVRERTEEEIRALEQAQPQPASRRAPQPYRHPLRDQQLTP